MCLPCFFRYLQCSMGNLRASFNNHPLRLFSSLLLGSGNRSKKRPETRWFSRISVSGRWRREKNNQSCIISTSKTIKRESQSGLGYCINFGSLMMTPGGTFEDNHRILMKTYWMCGLCSPTTQNFLFLSSFIIIDQITNFIQLQFHR